LGQPNTGSNSLKNYNVASRKILGKSGKYFPSFPNRPKPILL